jgi:hypothetical protein
MTAEEWLAEQKRAQWMLSTLLEPGKLQRTKAGKRKLRLFACGCCRMVWHLLEDEALRSALGVAERFADGEDDKEALRRAYERLRTRMTDGYSQGPQWAERQNVAQLVIHACSPQAGLAALGPTCFEKPLTGYSVGALDGEAALCHLSREVFGNPFRPVSVKREWRAANDRAAEAVARSIYDERAFDRLPILADALEDAGCGDEEILGHCRGPGRTFAAAGWSMRSWGRGNRRPVRAGVRGRGCPMTEEEWLACKSPGGMLTYLREQSGVARRKGGRRTLRLFACACCRRVWHKLAEDRDRRVVLLSEAFADGMASAEELESARRRCLDRTGRVYPAVRAAIAAADPQPRAAAKAVTFGVCGAIASHGVGYDERWKAEAEAMAGIVREVFGNPFRPAVLDPAWRTPGVAAVAHAIYEERSFDQLPILADALEDARCDDEAILGHCRGPGPHVRGCWALDLILAKA